MQSHEFRVLPVVDRLVVTCIFLMSKMEPPFVAEVLCIHIHGIYVCVWTYGVCGLRGACARTSASACMHVCTQARVCIHVCTCIYAHACPFVLHRHTRICACAHACRRTHGHAYVPCTCMHVHVCACAHACARTRVYVRVPVCVCTCTCVGGEVPHHIFCSLFHGASDLALSVL